MNSKPEYNPETVNAILDVMQKELEAEEGRDSSVLNKTNTILTVSGILLAVVSFLIHDFGGGLPQSLLLVLVISALCLFSSILLVTFFVIRTSPFERIDFTVLVGELGRDSIEVKGRLIATYKELLAKNSKILDSKVRLLWYSTLLIIGGTFFIISSIIYLYVAYPNHL
ncbi:MAG TPA: hypothetical protein ACFYD2_06005 [Candidatus Avalokitesvara rifleensis]|uniref:hypothetical protein n=1 Tax=Candidatus Avalokitesvara rifleensis TaxID=3367620 RepID=UPI00402A2424